MPYLTGTEPGVAAIIATAHPSYHGRRAITWDASNSVCLGNTYWDEGFRNTYSMVRLADMECVHIPNMAPEQFGGPRNQDYPIPIPAGFALVGWTQGPREAIHITINPVDAPQLLPAPTELSRAERIVLTATCSLKSSYGGIPNFRFSEARRTTGITRQDWEDAKASLQTKKLLNKAGAVTVDGRNARSDTDLYRIGKE